MATISTPFAFSQLVLVLNPVQSSVEEGQEVTFSGRISIEGQGLSNLSIDIKDAISGQIIGTTSTDTAGQFFLTWVGVYRGEPYLFYAEFVLAGAPASARSEMYEVLVTQKPIEESDTSETRTESGVEDELADSNSELAGNLDYINPDFLLLIIIPIAAAIVYAVYRSRPRSSAPRPSVEIRGGLD